MTTSNEQYPSYYELSLAIVGMSGRFPDADNVREFWQNLVDGVKSIHPLSDEELRAAGVDTELLAEPNYVKMSTKIAGIDQFDAPFFGFTPREAEVMDPQSRLFMHCVWEALEDAGYDPQMYNGRIGIFAGKHPSAYRWNNVQSNPQVIEEMGYMQLVSGNDADALASLVAYKLDLKGPSVSVQTFCSTSMVAVHLGCQSLLTYDCDLAIAGGVALQVPHGTGYMYEEGGILSPDGECRTFDAGANGSVLGSGLGVVILKRMEDALADGDHIYAVIRGSATNNDGLTRVSYAAPGLNGQAGVIAAAIGNAGVNAETIDYVEAHGTATPLGDSVELAAMTKVFQQRSQKTRFCAIGSVKPNIGHLDRASGVAGLIKTTLALHHKLLPPSLNCETPNPDFEWESSPFYVNKELREWAANGRPRRAGVSSFGMGGTNAHVILEEAPDLPSSPSRSHQLLLLSAKTAAALEIATSNLVHYLETATETRLADVAYTLQVGRAGFNHRRMIVCREAAAGASALASADAQQVLTQHQTRRERPCLFLFPGVGDHYAGMGRELYATEPVFREWVDRCCELLEPQLGLDLRTVLFAAEAEGAEAETGPDLRQMVGRAAPDESDSPLQQTALAQPAVFVVEYALAQLLQSWGIVPAGVMGYSLGEYVAACVAGVLSLADALRLVAARAQLIEAQPAGAMVAVSLPEDEVASYLDAKVDVAAVVGSQTTVLAGPVAAMSALTARLDAADVLYRTLPTRHAFHSAVMEEIADELTAVAAQVTLQPAQLPVVSNVTGTWLTEAEATDPGYWARHARGTVRFADGVAALLAKREAVLVEVGPGQSLGSFVKQHPDYDAAAGTVVLATLPYGYDRQPGDAFLLRTLGKLWLAGADIDWAGFYRHEQRRRVSLPTYPFENRRYWLEDKTGQQMLAPRKTGKKKDIGNWFYTPVWKQSPNPTISDTELPDDESWLLFLDELGLGERIAGRLAARGAAVVCVQAGESFAELDDNLYQVNPAEPEDYRLLLRALPGLPRHIVHGWGINPRETAVSRPEAFRKAQQTGFYSLLFLVQAIEQYTEALSIWALTADAQPVTGTEALYPEMATVQGACRVISQEHPTIACHAIDLERPQPGSWRLDWLADRLVAEFGQETEELMVAYRGNLRWVQAHEPIYLTAVAENRPAFRQNGVYLITGGLGGVGMIIARHLAETVRAKIVLTSRRPFPPPDMWDEWLATHDEDDGVNDKIRKLQEMEAFGAEVMIAQADVVDKRVMVALLAEVTERFGALHGVLHAAGISDGAYFAPIQELTVAQCEAHFQPKVYGLYVLEEALAEIELDFCVVFSSVSSVLGGLGFGGYATANMYIDAFTHQHNHRHAQWWTSVNWDTWQIRADQHDVLGKTVAEFEMLPAEAAQALERVIANGPITQLVNSTGDLDARLDQWVRMVSLHQADGGETTATHPRPEMMNAYVAPTNETESVIAEIWQDVLGVEPVGIEDNFLELGGHSLMAMQVLSRLRQRFQVNLPLTILFDAPTVAECAIAVALAIIEELEEEEQEEEMVAAVAEEV